MKRFWRENSLSIVMLGLFFVFFIFGQAYSGYLEANEDRSQHGQPTLRFPEYLTSAHFAEATMENWESEFLQMGVFIFFTAFLYQKGSAESKDPEKREEVDRDPRTCPRQAKCTLASAPRGLDPDTLREFTFARVSFARGERAFRV